MTNDPRKTYIAYALTVTLMFGVVGQLQGPIQWTREAEGTAQEDVFAKDTPNQAMLLLLGGLRAVAVNYFWVRAMTAQTEGRYHEILFNMNFIARLQPHFADAYVFQGWNAAYNISHEAEDLTEKYGWVMEGYTFLRRGVRKNPHLYKIKFWVAWILFDKIGNNMDPNQRAFFTKKYMEENNGRHPLRDAGIWFERASNTPGVQLLAHRMMMSHAYTRLADYYYLVGDTKKEESSILRAYQTVEEIVKEEPERVESLQELVRSWTLFKQLRARTRAAVAVMGAKPQDAADRLNAVLSEWEKEFKGNPFGTVVNLERAKVCELLSQDALDRLKTEKLSADYLSRAYVSYRRTFRRFPEYENLGQKTEELKEILLDYSKKELCPSPEKLWLDAQDL